MTLLDNWGVLQVEDFTVNVTGKYEYISDPPILGDIGTFALDLRNTTIIVNSSTTWDEEASALQVDISDLLVMQQDFNISFVGISDIADVASRLLTYVGNTIRSRVVSIIKYLGPKPVRLTKMINTLLRLIPDEIDIPGTDLYIEGGISRKFEIVKDKYMLLPLDISLQQKDRPLNYTNTADLNGAAVPEDFEFCMYLTSYLIDDALALAYRYNLTKIALAPVPGLTTSTLNALLLLRNPFRGFKHYGFDSGMPCAANATAYDMEPVIHVSKDQGISIGIALSANIKCKKKADDTDYS